MKPGLITEVEIVRWRDADTPIVRLTREFPVRLVACVERGVWVALAIHSAGIHRARKDITGNAGDYHLLFWREEASKGFCGHLCYMVYLGGCNHSANPAALVRKSSGTAFYSHGIWVDFRRIFCRSQIV